MTLDEIYEMFPNLYERRRSQGTRLSGGEQQMRAMASILRSGQSAPLSNSALIDAELARRKQPLEAYPLDVMAMVGSLSQDDQLVALVRVDSLLYQVRPGNYLGQNYGRVDKITETEIVLREIVQDAAGEWTERPAALQLQEEASK